MSTESKARHPVEELADEFCRRIRNGQQPSIQEYLDKYPESADEIGELFPMLQMMEEAAVRANQTQALGLGEEPSVSVPTQLGEFRIVREIGRGGMGIVYEAVQEPLGRHVALKVLPEQALQRAQARERFLREAQAASKLHHTNIVPVHAVGEQDGMPYFAMQYIRGQGLDRVLAELRRKRSEDSSSATHSIDQTTFLAEGVRTGSFAQASSEKIPIDATESIPRKSSTLPEGSSRFRMVARLGIQVAEALAYAHAHGILHRDIKPSNLLLDTSGTAWVMDFGLAKLAELDDLTESGDVVGTLRYLAPERLTGPADERSDVYSLGLTLYELLVGVPAFDQADPHRLMNQVMQDEPTPPRRIDATVPRDLETIVMKACAREPDKRYASAETFADDLKRFVEDRPILARRVRWWERCWRWCRRHPLAAVLTLLLLCSLLTIVAGSVWMADHFRRQRDRTAAMLKRAERAESAARKLVESLSRQISERTVGQVIEDTTQVIEAGRGNADTYLARGEAYLHLGKDEKALTDFRAGLEREPGNIWLTDYVAWVLAFAKPPLRDLDKALELSQKCVAQSPNSWGLLQTLGYIQIRLGKYERAAENLKHAISLRAHGGNAMMNLGLAIAEYHRGQIPSALKYYKIGATKARAQTELPAHTVHEWYLEATRLLADDLQE